MRMMRFGAALLVVGAIYMAAGKLGLDLAFDHPSSSPVWPPTGIAIAATILFGRRILPAVFAGAFLINQTIVDAPLCSLGIATGNTLEALLAAALIQRFAGGHQVFDQPQNVFRFAVFAGALAPAVSAGIGIGSLVLAGLLERSQVGQVWLTWWLGNGSGALLVTPLILLWRDLPRWNLARFPEAAALILSLLVVPGLVFWGLLPSQLVFVGLPLLAWSSFRFGRRLTSTSAAVLALIAILATLNDRGPFVGESLNDSLLMLQTFMAVAALTSLAMSAAVAHQRRVTDDVQRRAGTLEVQVVSRTEQVAELSERRLVERIAREEAERANRQKDEFLAVLSHELRTPLHTLAGWAELLQAPNLSEEQRLRAGAAIARSVGTQARLISDILDISRITAGKLELAVQRVDAIALVRGVIEVHQPLVQAKGITLTAELPPGELIVDADTTRIEQVLGNLLANAIKFTPSGGGIAVGLRARSNSVELWVTDDGPGIEPDLLPFIFDRFRQGDSSTTRRHGGLGLGLTIARHLVELHGGSITAGTRVEGGALLAVHLPRRTPDRRAPTAEAGEHDRLPHDALANARVLVVDDDPDGREFARVGLEGYGASVVTASGCDEALAYLDRSRFDLLITDLAMPDHDGYQLLESVRAVPGTRFLPAIALTAQASPQEADRARRKGFQAFVSKPVSLEQLVRMSVACVRVPDPESGGSVRDTS